MSALVIGHMNPDTDSITAAIACADLLKKLGKDVEPAAQGEPTPETKFVLDKFGLTAPKVVNDVAGKDLYMVDFSDLAQAPKGMDSACVKGIVDHHKLGDHLSAAGRLDLGRRLHGHRSEKHVRFLRSGNSQEYGWRYALRHSL